MSRLDYIFDEYGRYVRQTVQGHSKPSGRDLTLSKEAIKDLIRSKLEQVSWGEDKRFNVETTYGDTPFRANDVNYGRRELREELLLWLETL